MSMTRHTTTLLALLLAPACGGDSSTGVDTDSGSSGGSGTSNGSTSAGPGTASSTMTGPSTTASTESTTGSSTATSTSGVDTTAGATTGTTSGGECQVHADCPQTVPLCVEGLCLSCGQIDDGDAACAELDPSAPLCIDDACAQCNADDASACTGTTPVCDEPTNTCVGCTFHSQCPDSACKLDTGECFDAADTTDLISPNLAQAIQDLPADSDAVFRVSGSTDVDLSTTSTPLNGGSRIAIVRADGSSWAFTGPTNGAPAVDIEGSSTRVYLENVEIRQQRDNPVLLVVAARVYLDESQIANPTGDAVSLNTSAYLQARNTFMGSGGGDALTTGTATFDLVYSTLGVTFGSASPISCGIVDGSTIRNSLLLTQNTAPEIACSGVDVSYSAAIEDLGGTNTDLDPLIPTDYANYTGQDFHLTASAPSAISAAAQWQAGDPTWDIDGDPRPMTDGTPDFAGADVLP